MALLYVGVRAGGCDDVATFGTGAGGVAGEVVVAGGAGVGAESAALAPLDEPDGRHNGED